MYTGTQLTAARLQFSPSLRICLRDGWDGCTQATAMILIYVHNVYLSFPLSARSRLADTMVAVLT